MFGQGKTRQGHVGDGEDCEGGKQQSKRGEALASAKYPLGSDEIEGEPGGCVDDDLAGFGADEVSCGGGETSEGEEPGLRVLGGVEQQVEACGEEEQVRPVGEGVGAILGGPGEDGEDEDGPEGGLWADESASDEVEKDGGGEFAGERDVLGGQYPGFEACCVGEDGGDAVCQGYEARVAWVLEIGLHRFGWVSVEVSGVFYEEGSVTGDHGGIGDQECTEAEPEQEQDCQMGERSVRADIWYFWHLIVHYEFAEARGSRVRRRARRKQSSHACHYIQACCAASCKGFLGRGGIVLTIVRAEVKK